MNCRYNAQVWCVSECTECCLILIWVGDGIFIPLIMICLHCIKMFTIIIQEQNANLSYCYIKFQNDGILNLVDKM